MSVDRAVDLQRQVRAEVERIGREKREALVEAGQLLCGKRWQRQLAEVLGAHYPDAPRGTIDERLLRRWAAGERPIPGWVMFALARELDADLKKRPELVPSLIERLQKLGGKVQEGRP